MSEALDAVRVRLEEIDRRIIDLIVERRLVSPEVAAIKKAEPIKVGAFDLIQHVKVVSERTELAAQQGIPAALAHTVFEALALDSAHIQQALMGGPAVPTAAEVQRMLSYPH